MQYTEIVITKIRRLRSSMAL